MTGENLPAFDLQAYILSVDGIVKKNTVLDVKSLPKILMPNRDGFIDESSITH
jgi:cytochrome c